MVPVIVPAYAGLLTILYVFLSAVVIRSRTTSRITIGAGGDRGLERRMRIHANFAEYVPFALLLLLFMEMQGRSSLSVHGLCALLVAARIGHAVALWNEKQILRLRVASVAATFVVMLAAAGSALGRFVA
jgi:uncharacterized membrane protein YecN with MAPEG domain